MIDAMLTTFDNPHDPWDEYDLWYQWDERAGYHSTSLLARFVNFSSELSETDQALVIEQAIDEIVKENVSGMHRKLTREVSD